MNTVLLDFKQSARSIRRNPALATIVILTLGLGIGSATAIFSVIDAVLLRPLPYEHPDRIVLLFQNNRKSGIERDDASPANFLDWREQNQAFQGLAAIRPDALDYTG